MEEKEKIELDKPYEEYLLPVHEYYMEFKERHPELPVEAWMLTLTDDEFKILNDDIGKIFRGHYEKEMPTPNSPVFQLIVLYYNNGSPLSPLEILKIMLDDKDGFFHSGYVLARTINMVKLYKKGIIDFNKTNGEIDFDNIIIKDKFQFFRQV